MELENSVGALKSRRRRLGAGLVGSHTAPDMEKLTDMAPDMANSTRHEKKQQIWPQIWQTAPEMERQQKWRQIWHTAPEMKKHQIWHIAQDVAKKSDRAPDMKNIRYGTYGRYGKGGRFFSLC